MEDTDAAYTVNLLLHGRSVYCWVIIMPNKAGLRTQHMCA